MEDKNDYGIMSKTRSEQLETILVIRGYREDISKMVTGYLTRFCNGECNGEEVTTSVCGVLITHKEFNTSLLRHTLSDIERLYSETKGVLLCNMGYTS